MHARARGRSRGLAVTRDRMFGERDLAEIPRHSGAGRAHTASRVRALTAPIPPDSPVARVCGKCGAATAAVMLAMQAGRGNPWALCSGCYRGTSPAPTAARTDPATHQLELECGEVQT